MTEEELKEDFYQDMKRDAMEDSRRESAEQRLIRTDWYDALIYVGLGELEDHIARIVDELNELGWNVKASDVLNEI